MSEIESAVQTLVKREQRIADLERENEAIMRKLPCGHPSYEENDFVECIVCCLERQLADLRVAHDMLLRIRVPPMKCGHSQAALIVDDPPYCSVCEREQRIEALEKALYELEISAETLVVETLSLRRLIAACQQAREALGRKEASDGK